MAPDGELASSIATAITFDFCMREGKTCADFAEPRTGFTPEQAAARTIAERPTELVATSNHHFARALLEQGARTVRDALIMTANPQTLRATGAHAPHLPPHLSARFVEDLTARELFDSWSTAYPPEHPDHLPGNPRELIAAHLTPLLDHSLLGPNHRSSTALLADSNQAIAGIIISVREGEPPYGGPWVSEIWVDPAYQSQGIGRFLLTQALLQLAEDNFESIGLAVTRNNPAQKLYESLNFSLLEEAWTVELPAAPDDTLI